MTKVPIFDDLSGQYLNTIYVSSWLQKLIAKTGGYVKLPVPAPIELVQNYTDTGDIGPITISTLLINFVSHRRMRHDAPYLAHDIPPITIGYVRDSKGSAKLKAIFGKDECLGD